MKMDNEMLEGINRQLNHEFYSAYLYFAMSTYFLETNMEGFAKLIKEQAKEELGHAKKLYDYLIFRNEKVTLFQIEAPENNWVNPIDVISSALEHERFVTSQINSLFKKAREKEDYALEIFMQWFVDEQVEEENKFQTILDRMKNVQNCDCEIVHIDRELMLNKEYVE